MQGNQRPGQIPESSWFGHVANKFCTKYSVFPFAFLLVLFTYLSSLMQESRITNNTAWLSSRSVEFPLNCSSDNLTTNRTCPMNYYPTNFQGINREYSSSSGHTACPHYFHWIHEDLRPWRETGITREMVERANKTANFRLVILNGRAYVETYEKGFQTRDTFTLWGILQLLRRYPGQVPDLDLMFDCVDWPVVKSTDYQGPNSITTSPPPLFRYCGDHETLDIVFPDWSFWGWAEINIKPWELLRKELTEGNKKVEWRERKPYAFWKGNPNVAEKRIDLLKCNVTDKQDWYARVYAQDWGKESQHGYQQSNLADQCNYRYKIYIEGSAWSVSEKYILACDSVSLLVKPHYYDFFTRSLMPLYHYWPVREEEKCRDIKFAVFWGNTHKKKAQTMGKAASRFIEEDLKMDYVYDYMFHLLNEYAKLLNYKPTIPEKAVELCSEAMACSALGVEKKFMAESMARGPGKAGPCALPTPFDASTLSKFLRRKANSIRNVELLEQKYWEYGQKH